MDLKSSVEALLYASKEPISVSDISMITGATKEEVSKALKSLIREYSKRETSLRISRTGVRYKIQLKDEYHDIVMGVAEPEFSQEETRMLGLIASNSDVIRGVLRENFGQDYDQIVEKLKRAGFIKSRKYRNTELFRVTRKFYSHFHVSSDDIQEAEKDMNGQEGNE